jgi:plastocyanin
MSGRLLHRLLAALVFCALAALTLAACGGGGGGSKTACPPAQDPRVAVDNKVVVCAYDIRFDTKQIQAKAGPLTVTLANKGSLPHTFTVQDLNFEVKAGGGHDATGTSPPLVAGKTYRFICSTPGHESAMNGTIVVG